MAAIRPPIEFSTRLSTMRCHLSFPRANLGGLSSHWRGAATSAPRPPPGLDFPGGKSPGATALATRLITEPKYHWGLVAASRELARVTDKPYALKNSRHFPHTLELYFDGADKTADLVRHLLDTCSDLQMPLHALRYAHQNGAVPVLQTYEELAADYIRRREWVLVLRTVDLAIKHSNRCTTALLDSRALARWEVKSANLPRTLREFQWFKLQPSHYAYEIALRHAMKQRSIVEARKLIGEMRERGLSPFEPVTCDSKVFAGEWSHCFWREREMGEDALAEFDADGQQVVINGLLRKKLIANESAGIARILALLDPERTQVLREVLGIPEPPASQPRTINPNISIFPILIRHCFQKKDFASAERLLQEMLRQGVQPTEELTRNIMGGLFDAEQPAHAIQYVVGMARRQRSPQPSETDLLRLFKPIHPRTWERPLPLSPLFFDPPCIDPPITSALLARMHRRIVRVYGERGGVCVTKFAEAINVALDMDPQRHRGYVKERPPTIKKKIKSGGKARANAPSKPSTRPIS